MALTQAQALQLVSTTQGFAIQEHQALRSLIEDLYTRIDDLETLAASFGDLSGALENDTLAANSEGVFVIAAT